MSDDPLDDFRNLVSTLPAAEPEAEARTRATFQRWGAGPSRLAGYAARISRITGRPPVVNRPSVALFAGTHGIARRIKPGAQATDAEAFVAACGTGHAPVNHLCSANGFGLKVYDLALDVPTGDMAAEPALDARGCAATLAFGMEAIAGGTDLVVVGAARSAGQDAVAAALVTSCVKDGRADEVARGLGGAAWPAVQAAVSLHGDALHDPLETLRRVGGREFAALVGAILAARVERVPVILDGVAALAAASVLHALAPEAVSHCLLAEAASEAESLIADHLGLAPLLAAGTSAGEGTAGVIAGSMVRDAASLHAGLMAQGRG